MNKQVLKKFFVNYNINLSMILDLKISWVKYKDKYINLMQILYKIYKLKQC